VGAGQKHPRDVKMELAKKIVATYHDPAAAEGAAAEFVSVKQKGNLPANIPAVAIAEKTINIVDLVAATGAATSKSEARRLVAQGGVKIDNQKKTISKR